MKTDTISPQTARRFYDWLGARHDWGSRFERQAKDRAVALLDAGSAEQVLNVGVGTGKEQRKIQAALPAIATASPGAASRIFHHPSRSYCAVRGAKRTYFGSELIASLSWQAAQ